MSKKFGQGDIQGHVEPMKTKGEKFSANLKALVCVDCSMEERPNESSSKGVLLDVHYI